MGELGRRHRNREIRRIDINRELHALERFLRRDQADDVCTNFRHLRRLFGHRAHARRPISARVIEKIAHDAVDSLGFALHPREEIFLLTVVETAGQK